MRIEISALFPLHLTYETIPRKFHIGGGVFIERLELGWLNELKSQCPKVAAMEQLEPVGEYTHRFFYEIVLPKKGFVSLDALGNETERDVQLLMRAIILSRIIKPTSIAYSGLFVKSFYRDSETVKHKSNPYLNNHNIAYVEPDTEIWNTITESDLNIIAELWDSFQFFFDDANSSKPKYSRILRSIKFNEIAYAISFAEISHTISHTALETIICSDSQYNKAQVTQRLPQLVSFISQKQAKDIYLLCCDFKHSASGLLKDSPTINNVLSSSDQSRKDAVILLRRALRYLLTKSLRERQFADILADPQLLKQTYKVHKNGKLI